MLQHFLQSCLTLLMEPAGSSWLCLLCSDTVQSCPTTVCPRWGCPQPPRQGSPKPSWGVLQPLRGVPSPLSSPRGSLCPIPPRTHQFLHVDQPIQEGLAAFMQEGQI